MVKDIHARKGLHHIREYVHVCALVMIVPELIITVPVINLNS